MLCEKCKKNIATIHMTEMFNGSRNDVHLCEQCAERDFILPYFKMSFPELLKSLINDRAAMQGGRRNESDRTLVRKCRACGTKYATINLSTEFGCPNDYQVFSKQVDKLLRKYNNGNSVHSGKLPLKSLEKTRRENRSMLLQMRIEDAVRSENYELAAEMRDQLNAL